MTTINDGYFNRWGPTRAWWVAQPPASTSMEPITTRITTMKLTEIMQRGTRAAQPAANTLPEGTLYFVTDESKIEQVIAGAWVAYS